MTIHRIVWTIVIVAVLASSGYAVWTLRQPLATGLSYLQQTASGEDFRFVVVGDNHGVNDVYRQIISEISGQDYAFMLNVADTSEDGTRTEFEAVRALEQRLPFPTFHVLGNHDIATDASGQVFADVFETEPCSSREVRGLRIITLNNASRRAGFPEACLDWFEEELAGAPEQPTVVAYHRPFRLPLSAIIGDDETATSRPTTERFMSILGKYPNIKYVFTGHVHTYLPYTLGDTPAVVTGGGGDPAQSAIGGAVNNYFHYLIVRYHNRTVTPEVRRVQLSS